MGTRKPDMSGFRMVENRSVFKWSGFWMGSEIWTNVWILNGLAWTVSWNNKRVNLMNLVKFFVVSSSAHHCQPYFGRILFLPFKCWSKKLDFKWKWQHSKTEWNPNLFSIRAPTVIIGKLKTGNSWNWTCLLFANWMIKVMCLAGSFYGHSGLVFNPLLKMQNKIVQIIN